MRKYWMAFCNDGDAITGIEHPSKALAINDCKQAFKFDYAQCGHDTGNEYYIQQFEELEGLSAVVDIQILKMTLGKKGSVHCERREDAQ